MGDKSRGLYPEGKFIVRRRDGSDETGGKHDSCNYFVLDVTHDPHAIPALRSYAASARKEGYELLANDLEGIAATATTLPSETAVGGEAKTEICPICKNEVPLDSMWSYNNVPNAFCQGCIDSGRV